MVEERGMFMVHQTIGSVLCCKCGIPMAPNAANMCMKCLRSEVDITEGLQKHVVIIHCPECDSYLQPPRTWLKAQLESKKLLTFCVKNIGQRWPDSMTFFTSSSLYSLGSKVSSTSFRCMPFFIWLPCLQKRMVWSQNRE